MAVNDHPLTAAVQDEIQQISVMDQSEIVPNAGGQVFAQVDTIWPVAEIHFDVERTVGQQSDGDVIGVRERSAGIKQDRISNQSLKKKGGISIVD